MYGAVPALPLQKENTSSYNTVGLSVRRKKYRWNGGVEKDQGQPPKSDF